MRRYRPPREERTRRLPGDARVAAAPISLDHATTLPAPPERVWPWLARMGAGRAGRYSRDRLDNGGTPSARRILDGLQEIGPGTLMPALPGVRDCIVVTALRPPRHLLLGVPGPGGVSGKVGSARWRGSYSRASWEFTLTPRGGATPLLVRARTALAETSMPLLGRVRVTGRLARPAAALIHAIMQRKQLAGLRARLRADPAP